MADYAVYLDDSGHPSDQPYVVVAGFLSSEAGWLAFETDWKAALRKHKLGPVFHMAEFHGKRSKGEEGKILEELTAIILKHLLYGFSVIIDMKDYRKVNDYCALEESIGTPFAIASRTVARGINEWKARHLKPGDRLVVFVEDGTKHMGDMEEAFRRDKLPVPQRAPKKHTAVQPGDLLAWETFHYCKRGDRRRCLVNLVKGMDMFEGTMREHNLLHAAKAIGAPKRAGLTPNAQMFYHSTPKRLRKRTIK